MKIAIAPAAVAAGVAITLGGVGARGAAAAAPPHTLYVSPAAAPGNAGTSCSTASYSTIGAAVSAAADGATVNVCPGTYTEMVAVSGKHLTLSGSNATVDASGRDNGVLISGDKAAHSVVQRFTVENATGEGILALNTSHVTVEHNVVHNNDLGGQPPSPDAAYPECQEHGQIPGDCGEGIHLMTVADSSVADNDVEHNAGGILLTDEFGPTHGNKVTGNVASNNICDCGITVPGHNPDALDSKGHRQPSKGGVYDNKIDDNTIEGNGTAGEGAGILFAAAGPGMASYNNEAKGNTINGNELAGITIHSHTPNQDVSGNHLTDNRIGTSNTGGDPDAGDFVTTAIVISSSVVAVLRTQIEHNWFYSDNYGIYTVNAEFSKDYATHNSFTGVAIPVHQQ